MEAFLDAEVGVLENGKVNIMVSRKEILTFAAEALKDTKLNLKPYDYKIIDENKTKYIRIYSNNNYVSTAEIIVDENDMLKVGKTVCTSQHVNGGECVPNGDFCTSSAPVAPGLSGDCTRTTTGG